MWDLRRRPNKLAQLLFTSYHGSVKFSKLSFFLYGSPKFQLSLSDYNSFFFLCRACSLENFLVFHIIYIAILDSVELRYITAASSIFFIGKEIVLRSQLDRRLHSSSSALFSLFLRTFSDRLLPFSDSQSLLHYSLAPPRFFFVFCITLSYVC